jgi:hypothetical protein
LDPVVILARFSPETGHYTQLVWAQTAKVGCGFVQYGKNEQLLVCNYLPAGNTIGQKMYEQGSACSMCPSSHSNCDDSLCIA